jgi:hypothetical protein
MKKENYECNFSCQYIKDFVRIYPNPLYAEIKDYFNEVSKDARTCYHRAKRNGYEVIKIGVITDKIEQDIFNIYTSKPERQGRMVNTLYHLPEGGDWDIREGWPHKDYFKTCPKHYYEFYGCFLKGEMVAFLELLRSGDLTITYSTMGHADHLSKGIMKFMFIEAVKMGKIKYLVYGDKENHLGYFLPDLNIIKCDPEFIYKLSYE